MRGPSPPSRGALKTGRCSKLDVNPTPLCPPCPPPPLPSFPRERSPPSRGTLKTGRCSELDGKFFFGKKKCYQPLFLMPAETKVLVLLSASVEDLVSGFFVTRLRGKQRNYRKLPFPKKCRFIFISFLYISLKLRYCVQVLDF